MNSIATACYIIAIACYAYCAFGRAKNKFERARQVTCYVAILSQFLGIYTPQLPLVLAPLAPKEALALFALLSVLSLAVFDYRVNFPRCLRWLCFFALCTSVVAMLPVSEAPPLIGKNFNFHLFLAMIAYSMFLMSFVQMVETWLVNRAISRHAMHDMPGKISLLDMEQIVFRNIFWSFAMLTLTMISGLISATSSDSINDAIAHEIIFASMTWIFCAVLLLGRWRWGWRGIVALRWFAASSLSLVLNYITVVVLIKVLLD